MIFKSLPGKHRRFVSLARFNSRGGGNPAPPAALPPTTQLVQLIGQLVLRGEGFLTPPDKGVLLDGRMTIRRRAESSGSEPYPEDELEITQDSRAVLRLKADKGEHTLAWNSIGGLPENLQNGLPPGEYTLRAKSGGASATFRVMLVEMRERVMRRAGELERLLGGADDALYVQVAADAMLAYRDEHGNPQPLLADALDLLDAAGSQPLSTGNLQHLQADICRRLEGKRVAATPDRDATGIPAIDDARDAIASGKWHDALGHLQAAESSQDARTRAFARLYRAVILAESGQATGNAAQLLFVEAIDALRDGSSADRFRAHNNFAVFLLNRAQDRIYNHAFQMASGVENPLVASLLDWHIAREHFQAALAAAETGVPAETATVRVNLARLYSTLADLLRVIGTSSSDEPLLKVAEDWAGRMAREAAGDRADGDPMVRAVGQEILAHLAFRRGANMACLEHANQARELYLNAGSLAGCESIYRLRGLLRCATNRGGDDDAGRSSALNDLLVSHLLAELLRERIPGDQVGLRRAGFLARRAYVTEKVVELLIDAGRDAQALRFAELAKARALQDVLAADRSPVAARVEEAAAADDVLADWPTGIAAIEYFVGSERAWLFVVTPRGPVSPRRAASLGETRPRDASVDVKAYPICDEQGQPIASRELIARVQRLIGGLDKLGPVEGRRIAHAAARAGKASFEQSWQHELHWFYNTLIPAECRPSLRPAEMLVVVPHHLLHYFPFAALVTQPDAAEDPTHMPLPRFFVEEPFSLVHAPSLTTWRLLREKPNRPLDQVNVVGIVDFGGRAIRLDGVKTEITNMQEIFGPRIRQIVTDRQATESIARELVTRPGILSISTHGQKVPDRPLEAYLVCQADENNDGYLRAGEIYGLDVQSDLVLLNACYGGFADRSPLPGDDLFGVQRALLHSGARTVVSGLWDIYDATSPDIMKDFWQRVASGIAAPQALAEAQRAYLKAWREFPQEPLRFLTHPYYWAVFTVAGDDRTGGNGQQAAPVARATSDATKRDERVQTPPPATVANGRPPKPAPPQDPAKTEPVAAVTLEPAVGKVNRKAAAPSTSSVAAGPAPSRPKRQTHAVSDAAFDRFVDFTLIQRALISRDAALLVDVALQLADAERILGRNHPALTAEPLLALAARFAVAGDDGTTLDRLLQHAQAHPDSPLNGQIASARRLAGRSRDAESDRRVSVLETSSEAYAEYHALVRDIRLAVLLGDADLLSQVERDLAAARKLSPTHCDALRGLLREAQEVVKNQCEGDRPSSETLAVLSGSHRIPFAQECRCECHHSALLHFARCCHRCPGCGKRIVASRFRQHAALCEAFRDRGRPMSPWRVSASSVAEAMVAKNLLAPSRSRSIFGRWRSGGRFLDFDPSGWMEIQAANGNVATFQFDIDDTTGNPDFWIITGTDKTGYKSRGIIQWIDDDSFVWRGDIGALTYRRVP